MKYYIRILFKSKVGGRIPLNMSLMEIFTLKLEKEQIFLGKKDNCKFRNDYDLPLITDCKNY